MLLGPSAPAAARSKSSGRWMNVAQSSSRHDLCVSTPLLRPIRSGFDIRACAAIPPELGGARAAASSCVRMRTCARGFRRHPRYAGRPPRAQSGPVAGRGRRDRARRFDLPSRFARQGARHSDGPRRSRRHSKHTRRLASRCRWGRGHRALDELTQWSRFSSLSSKGGRLLERSL